MNIVGSFEKVSNNTNIIQSPIYGAAITTKGVKSLI